MVILDLSGFLLSNRCLFFRPEAKISLSNNCGVFSRTMYNTGSFLVPHSHITTAKSVAEHTLSLLITDEK